VQQTHKCNSVQVQDVSQDCSITEQEMSFLLEKKILFYGIWLVQKKSISVTSEVATTPNFNPEKEIQILKMAILKSRKKKETSKVDRYAVTIHFAISE